MRYETRAARRGEPGRRRDTDAAALSVQICWRGSERTWTMQMRQIRSDQELLDAARGDSGNDSRERDARRGLSGLEALSR
jgi:hypothetical protein